MLRTLGGTPGRVLIVGCEPLRCEEEMGLSPPVELAVGVAVELILGVVGRELQAQEQRDAVGQVHREGDCA